MVRALCCEKIGLKKGPWTLEEDQILTSYITKYGHGNWRALPKQAGLLRCGKSCRLRWVNYLRPDIKRGNFNQEEQDAVIELHELFGNKWSAIAARLPGRTDNEIKNVWHTHLKKRVKENKVAKEMKPLLHQYSDAQSLIQADELIDQDTKAINCLNQILRPTSPQYSGTANTSANYVDNDALDNYLLQIDAEFWSDVFPVENSSITCDFPVAGDSQVKYDQYCPINPEQFLYDNKSVMADDIMDFWFRLAALPEL